MVGQQIRRAPQILPVCCDIARMGRSGSARLGQALSHPFGRIWKEKLGAFLEPA